MIFHCFESEDGKAYQITPEFWIKPGAEPPRVIFDPVDWKPLAFWDENVLHRIILIEE